MHESLRGETTQQALDKTVLEMELHNVVGDLFRRFEDDRAKWRRAPPLEVFLAVRRQLPTDLPLSTPMSLRPR
jgi:hypothetical protein